MTPSVPALETTLQLPPRQSSRLSVGSTSIRSRDSSVESTKAVPGSPVHLSAIKETAASVRSEFSSSSKTSIKSKITTTTTTTLSSSKDKTSGNNNVNTNNQATPAPSTSQGSTSKLISKFSEPGRRSSDQIGSQQSPSPALEVPKPAILSKSPVASSPLSVRFFISPECWLFGFYCGFSC